MVVVQHADWGMILHPTGEGGGTILLIGPMCFYQVADFAWNLKIHTDMGKDLFSPKGLSATNWLRRENAANFFPGIEVITLSLWPGLLYPGLLLSFWMEAVFFTALSMMVKNLILAGMFVALSQLLRRRWLVTLGGALVFCPQPCIWEFIST